MFWIIIFLIGLMGVSIMLYRETSLIKKNNVQIDNVGEKTLVSRERVADISTHLWESFRLNSHKAIISILKGWVIFTHKTNKYIKDKLASRPEGKENGTVSTFLTTVSDYKDKMKKMRTRLKQRDE